MSEGKAKKRTERDQYCFNSVPMKLYYPKSQEVSFSFIPIYIQPMTILV